MNLWNWLDTWVATLLTSGGEEQWQQGTFTDWLGTWVALLEAKSLDLCSTCSATSGPEPGQRSPQAEMNQAQQGG